MIKLPNVLAQPKRPSHLPLIAKWLSGEGAGSWFVIEGREDKSIYKITRFSPEGKVECEGIFTADKRVNLKKYFEITYPAHCKIVNIVQDMDRVRFKKIDH